MPKQRPDIQGLVMDIFKHCNVFTIAHRLNTVIDYDRVMVLDHGRLVELDSPWNLLQNEDSLFSRMIKKTGPEEEQKMRERAYAHRNS